MKRISLFLVLILVLSMVVVGCNNSTPSNDNPKEPVDVVIGGLKGPSSMGMIKVIDEASISENYNTSFIIEGAPDALTGKLINGEVQIAALPTNLASVLYNRTEGKIQFLALDMLGVIHIVGTENISSLEDLEGKTLHISGKGSTPEYAVKYMLEQKGLSDKVELKFYPDHTSLAQTVIAGDTSIAVLPQPFVTQVTMKNTDVKLLVDLNEAWNEIAGNNSTFAMSCLVINKEFAENNKEYVKEFLKQFEASVNWVNENPAEAGTLIEKHGILANAKLAELAVPNCNLVYQSAQESKNVVDGYLKVLYNFNPSAVGGKMPDEGFYYSE